ncbi:MAG: radical SAM protein [Candidatus Omnitrophica bacterium]|nr:radical SAM protein [Candidatus Omnitrophota bacterium]
MCHLWKNDERNIPKPSTEEWRGFIKSLGNFMDPGSNIIFGGGEPLLYPDLLVDLISLCHQLGYRTSLATSGYFVDEKMAGRLVRSGLDYIALTLYSLRKETHNYLRGMPDSHEMVLQAINYLSELKSPLEIAIDTVIMDPNLYDLIELAQWVRNDKRLQLIFFQAVVQPFHTKPDALWQNDDDYGFLWPKDTEEVVRVIDGLIKIKSDAIVAGQRDKVNNTVSQFQLFKSYFRNPQEFVKRFSCNVTQGQAFTVSPEGGVNLCPYMNAIGNIRESSIKDIWYSKQAAERQVEIGSCAKNCHHIINCWYEEEDKDKKGT